MQISACPKSCAIIVTHNPDITALLELSAQLKKETDFIIVDNGTHGISAIVESITVYEKCKTVIFLEENEGLAKALNIGIAWALKQNYDFVFLFDQDSSLCDLFVKRMIDAFFDASEKTKLNIAAVGPRIINPQTMRQTNFKLFSRFIFRSDIKLSNSSSHYFADFLITSGTLLYLDALASIGVMKESFFIDNIDLEWCFRAKSKGYELIGTDEAVLYHAIGERSSNPLVRAGIMAQHNPQRSYFSSRNRVHLYSVDYSPAGWKYRDICRFILKAMWLLITSRDRKDYFKNILSGIKDAKLLA
tara:strand:+ start:92 stop:1000 length:909 start_codon:yes stop_codon:yes gene_type:complete